VTVEEIAAHAAEQTRKRVLRVGGYCPFGCSYRCDCAGSLWPPSPMDGLTMTVYRLDRADDEPPPSVRFSRTPEVAR
jgi:hypothetical protein